MKDEKLDQYYDDLTDSEDILLQAPKNSTVSGFELLAGFGSKSRDPVPIYANRPDLTT